jgi:hypothetical protein
MCLRLLLFRVVNGYGFGGSTSPMRDCGIAMVADADYRACSSSARPIRSSPSRNTSGATPRPTRKWSAIPK